MVNLPITETLVVPTVASGFPRRQLYKSNEDGRLQTAMQDKVRKSTAALEIIQGALTHTVNFGIRTQPCSTIDGIHRN